jgi:hypothetical protein
MAIHCHQCLHEVILNVYHLPGHLTVPSFGPKMACASAGRSGPMCGRTGGNGFRGEAARAMAKLGNEFRRVPHFQR